MTRTAPTAAVRALTFKQPWAWAITHDTKRTENRTWEPARGWRGPLALHAGKQIDEPGLRTLAHTLDDLDVRPPRRTDLVLGAVVAIARLTEVHTADLDRCGDTCGPAWGVFPELEQLGRTSAGAPRTMYHWCLTDVTILRRPVPCPGAMQLWTLPPAAAAAVRAQTVGSPAWRA